MSSRAIIAGCWVAPHGKQGHAGGSPMDLGPFKLPSRRRKRFEFSRRHHCKSQKPSRISSCLAMIPGSQSVPSLGRLGVMIWERNPTEQNTGDVCTIVLPGHKGKLDSSCSDYKVKFVRKVFVFDDLGVKMQPYIAILVRRSEGCAPGEIGQDTSYRVCSVLFWGLPRVSPTCCADDAGQT